jgi:dienelactone hydrolase
MNVLLAVTLHLCVQNAQDKVGQVVAKKTTSVERDWSLYVPRGYNPRVPAPFILSSHGRDGRGKGEINQWTDLAEKHGWIVAAADFSISSGRPGTIDDDEKVALEIWDYVTKTYAVDRKACMVTGFSGGGHITYGIGSRHPDKFTYWGGRSANFAAQLIAGEELLKKAAETVSIYIYYGSKDHEFILAEAPRANEFFTKAGFKDIKFEKIEGMGHESRAGTCAAWFKEKVDAAKKREAMMAPAVKAMEAADKALEKGNLSTAVSELKKADAHMKKLKLGDDAAKRIEELATKELERAATAEKDEGIKILEAARKAFAGTDAGKRIEEKLKELKP